MYVLTEPQVEHKRAGLSLFIVVSGAPWVTFDKNTSALWKITLKTETSKISVTVWSRGDRSHFFDSCSCSKKVSTAPAPKLIKHLHPGSCLHSENLEPRNKNTWCSHLNQVSFNSFTRRGYFRHKTVKHLLLSSYLTFTDKAATSKTIHNTFFTQLIYLSYIVNLQDNNSVFRNTLK